MYKEYRPEYIKTIDFVLETFGCLKKVQIALLIKIFSERYNQKHLSDEEIEKNIDSFYKEKTRKTEDETYLLDSQFDLISNVSVMFAWVYIALLLKTKSMLYIYKGKQPIEYVCFGGDNVFDMVLLDNDARAKIVALQLIAKEEAITYLVQTEDTEKRLFLHPEILHGITGYFATVLENGEIRRRKID